MAVPWRAAEAMHWQLGEADMARRAGVVPLSNVTMDAPPPSDHRSSPSRDSRPSAQPVAVEHRVQVQHTLQPARNVWLVRQHAALCNLPPATPSVGLALATIGGGMGRGAQLLPGISEMMMGVPPYNPPAYAMPMSGGYSSPGPMLPSICMMKRPEAKRRRSPDIWDRGRQVGGGSEVKEENCDSYVVPPKEGHFSSLVG